MPIAPSLHEHVEVRRSLIHGKGVFAKRNIRKHSLVGVFEGSATMRNGRYVLWVENDEGELVGIRGQNELRYLNHSRRANACFRGDKLFALANIRAGAEITFDYGEDWSEFE